MSSVLLVNFSGEDANRLTTSIPVSVNRGYLGKTNTVITSMPPVYENEVAFISLDKESHSEKEMGGDASYSHQDVKNILEYWYKGRGTLVLFLGNLNFYELTEVGVFEVSLENANKGDKDLSFYETKDFPLLRVLQEVKGMIKKPLGFYISQKGKWTEDKYQQPELRPLYRNRNRDWIGAYIDFEPHYDSDNCDIRVIILPQYSDKIAVIEKIIKALATQKPDLFPEIIDTEWASSDSLYPTEVQRFKASINELVNKTRAKVEELNNDRDRLLEKYAFLPKLLTSRDEELKQAVIESFKILDLEIKDADADKSGELAEDVLIKGPNGKILGEVKGTVKKNPKDTDVGQVWKHLALMDDVKQGALIINFDIRTEPSSRPRLYPNDKLFEGLILIDTRELHKVVIAVIDGRVNKRAAAKALLAPGRFEFESLLSQKE